MVPRKLISLSGRLCAGSIAIVAFVGAGVATARDNPFGGGWTLDPSASSLTFQSVKNGSTVETSGFAVYDGEIDEQGVATVRVQLNSIDTKVDLRNVRMRFLFFETFRYPRATVTATVDPGTMAELESRRRLQLPVSFDLDLHGVTRTLEVRSVLTMFADDQVSIASVSPVSVEVEPFGLMEGIRKLEEAADVTIVPSASVSFDLIFRRGRGAAPTAGSEAAPAADASAVMSMTAPVTAMDVAASTAIESSGEFSREECVDRFETLSRTEAVYFRFGSAELDPESRPLLSTLIDIVERCPSLDIVVTGHTDSSGPEDANMRLSMARAESVRRYLVEADIASRRVRAVGFGESRPVAPNDTRENRRRNRRIEFSVDGG